MNNQQPTDKAKVRGVLNYEKRSTLYGSWLLEEKGRGVMETRLCHVHFERGRAIFHSSATDARSVR
jgi:hypothetical protein